MKKRRHVSHAPGSPNPGGPAKPSPKGRRWIFAVLALVLVPSLVFVLVEVVLRLAGYGCDTAFFKSARIGDRDYLVNNDDFVLRFFPPDLARLPGALRMAARKEPGTRRIFILGESAALGDPSPPYGAGRYLQVLLEKKFPGQKFEVVNVSITAINSHVIFPIARECAKYEGDVWIIYMGNNEMVGPFGAATIFGSQAPPVWSVRLGLALQTTRVGQLLMSAMRGIQSKSANPHAWAGMEMFLGHRLPPDDPRKEAVYRNFQRNLHDIVEAGLDSGATVVLNTVAVNLKDCPPFASTPRNALDADSRARCETLAANAEEARRAGDFRAAAAKFSEALKIQPTAADLHYSLARCLLRQTNYGAARQHFQLACDFDELPFRTDSILNDLIRQAARMNSCGNLAFVEVAAILASNNPAGVCGDETFLEHVHFNFDGNYRLGRLWANAIEPIVRGNGSGKVADDWAAQEDCEAALALTDWNRMMTLSEVFRRRHRPPLDSQVNNAEELAALTNASRIVRSRLTVAEAERARTICLQAIQREPDDHLLRFNYADFLEATGKWPDAASVWRETEATLPGYYLCYLQEGRMLENAGRLDEAATAFRQCLKLHPRTTVAWFELSNIDASNGRVKKALAECDRAAKLEPSEAAFVLCKGKLLARMNQPANAAGQFREAIRMRPGLADAHMELGRALAQEGARDEARQEFEEVLRLEPNNAAAREQLANFAP